MLEKVKAIAARAESDLLCPCTQCKDRRYLLRLLEIAEGALEEYKKGENWSCVHQSLHRADVGHECSRDWWHVNDGPAIARQMLKDMGEV